MKTILIISLGCLLFISQGCSSSVSQIHMNKGMVKVGMNKEEILALWGNPYHKWLQEQSVESDMWLYPGKYWWGANQILLRFNEDDILEEIELIHD